jgi:uncharacterized protein
MTSQMMSRGTVARAAAAALLLGGAFVLGAAYSGRPAHAAANPLLVAPLPTTPTSLPEGGSTPGITVTGTSEVAGTPDTLRLDLAVTMKASTVTKALEQANGVTSRVQSSLRHSGVAAKDLQTSNLQIQPEYSYPSAGTPMLTGYTVTEGLTARLRDLGRAGAAITAAVGAGGDAVQVGGIALDLEDTGALLRTARDQAVSDARAKAEQYARAAGRTLGQVVSISEAMSTPPPISYQGRVPSAAAMSQAVPIQPGSENVTVTVTVVYAFG